MPKKMVFTSLCLFFCIIQPSSLFAQQQDCEKLQSTVEKGACLVRELTQVEAEMNRAFQQALSDYLPSAKIENEAPKTKMSKLELELLREAGKAHPSKLTTIASAMAGIPGERVLCCREHVRWWHYHRRGSSSV